MIIKKVLGVKNKDQKLIYLPSNCDIKVGEYVCITKLIIEKPFITTEKILINKGEEKEKSTEKVD